MFKKKELKKRDPYFNFPKFCKYDGLLLIDGLDVIQTYFDEEMGNKVEEIRYKRYCRDWQINRQLHTEYYSGCQIKRDAPTNLDKKIPINPAHI